MNQAVFVVSTGRCGTQWMAQALREQCGDRLRVEHEPLDGRIDPREVLGIANLDESDSVSAEVMRSHVDDIARGLAERSYIECGHVGWSAVPHFALRLAGRVRIVHLVRHPVPTTYSWLSHGAYEPPLLPHLSERVLISPCDAGVRFPHYREQWDVLTPFEKGLYFWLEVNTAALETEQNSRVPWLRLRAEDLFAGTGWEALAGFLGLPLNTVSEVGPQPPVDEFRYLVRGWHDWRVIERHPEVRRLMREFSYTLGEVDEESLRQRYLGHS